MLFFKLDSILVYFYYNWVRGTFGDKIKVEIYLKRIWIHIESRKHSEPENEIARIILIVCDIFPVMGINIVPPENGSEADPVIFPAVESSSKVVLPGYLISLAQEKEKGEILKKLCHC